MRCIYTAPHRRSTRCGLFHNLDESSEDTGYISLHVFGARLSVYWARQS